MDYWEIPALVAVSLVYANELRQGFSWKALLFLLFLNSPVAAHPLDHRRVRGRRAGRRLGEAPCPAWLAWVAILIDYLELPVIFDTLKRLATAVRQRRLPSAPISERL